MWEQIKNGQFQQYILALLISTDVTFLRKFLEKAPVVDPSLDSNSMMEWAFRMSRYDVINVLKLDERVVQTYRDDMNTIILNIVRKSKFILNFTSSKICQKKDL